MLWQQKMALAIVAHAAAAIKNIANTSAACLLLGSLTIAPTALADAPRVTVAPLPRYTQECGACHLAYPPGLLPAPSWKRLMGGLTQHFGTDASLDAASAREISTWLQDHAGTTPRVM